MKKTLDFAAVAFTALSLLGFLFLAVRGLAGPEQASAQFGLPVSDAAGALFYRVYLSRNLVITVTALIFLLRRQWTPLAILITATAALPIFDMAVLTLSGTSPPAFHIIALVLLGATATLLWRRARHAAQEAAPEGRR